MSILDEKDGGDSELLVYAMTLINKVTLARPDLYNSLCWSITSVRMVSS